MYIFEPTPPTLHPKQLYPHAVKLYYMSCMWNSLRATLIPCALSTLLT